MPLPRPSALARHWGLDPGVVFLNHGSFGACPLPVLARQRELRERLEREPVRFFAEDLEGLLDAARHELAAFVNADPEGLAFVPNATVAVNAIARWLPLKAGDELVVTSHEYNACVNALRAVAEPAGAVVRVAEAPWPLRSEEEVAGAVLGAVGARTRLVLVSHVTSPTGVIFPVERIVRELNGRGVDTLVDGAHGPGMLGLNLRELGAPYYTGNCHKWLCSPKGAGFVYVREDRRERTRPLAISHGANSARTDRSRFRLEWDWTGSADPTAALCVPEAIRFVGSLDPEGWPGVMRRNRGLALRAREIFCRELGAEPPAPAEMIGSLASVPIPARPGGAPARPSRYHDALQDDLIRGWGVQMPVVPFPARSGRRMVRVSAQLYNSEEQMAYAARAVRAALEGEAGASGAAGA